MLSPLLLLPPLSLVLLLPPPPLLLLLLLQETDHWVQTMREAMARDGQRLVPFVRLVVNHRSFSQTVENIFALSFLVK